MIKWMSGLFIVVLSLCLLAGPAWSATVGKITGRVTDAGGKPLPGVNVAVQGTRYGAVSDADGYYLILSVEPGIYELKVSIIGYETVREKNVQVLSDRTTTRDFRLKETAVAGAEVVVQAQRPLVEVDRTASESKISERDIEQIPILRDVKEHLQYVAGVDPTNPSANGARIRRAHYTSSDAWQTWTLDGMELSLLDTGFLSVRQYSNLSVTSIGEIAVVKGGQSADQASALSGVVNIVSREGTRVFHGGIDYRAEVPGRRHRGPNVYDATAGQRGGANGLWQNRLRWSDTDWVNEVDAVTGKQIHVKQDYEGTVGHLMEGWVTGPLGENATFVVSGKMARAKQTFPAPERLGLPQWSIFGKLTFTPTSNLKLKLGYNQSNEPRWQGDQRGPNTNLFLVRGRGHTGYEQQWKNRLVYLTATHTINPRTFHEFQIGFYGTNIDTTADTDPITDSFRRDRRGEFNLDRRNRNLTLDYNRRYNFRYDFTSQVTRRNLLKIGLAHQIYHNTNWQYLQTSPTSGTIFVIAKDSVPGERYLAQRFAGYVEEKLEFQGFVMNAGLRFDALWGGPKKTLLSWYKAMPQWRTFKAYRTRTPLAHTKPMITWSPHVSASHPITARSAVRFTFGRYYKPAIFGSIWGEGWNGKDLKNHPNLDDVWLDEPWIPGGGWRLDSGFHNPAGLTNTTEFEVSGEWNFIGDFVLDIATYYRRTERLNAGTYRRAFDPIQGSIGDIQGVSSHGRFEAKGAEVSLYKPLSHNFSFRLSLDVGWSLGYSAGGLGSPRAYFFYPDSTYIAGPNYFLVDKNDDPVRLTEAQIRDIGAKANDVLRKLEGSLRGQTKIERFTTMPRPFSEFVGLSDSERNLPELQGLWYTILYLGQKGPIFPPPTTQASFQFLWSTPSNWGPGPSVGGSKLLGGIQANLVWRFDSGNVLRYAPPGSITATSRSGPLYVRADLNFQKTFEMRRVRPTVYAEVFNLFDSYVDRSASASYVRWGLQRPTPNDGNYVRYGDPSPFRGGDNGGPRFVNVGVRFGF